MQLPHARTIERLLPAQEVGRADFLRRCFFAFLLAHSKCSAVSFRSSDRWSGRAVNRRAVGADGAAFAGPDAEAGGRWRDHRQVIDAIAWMFQTGSQWVHLPAEYGSWKGVCMSLRNLVIDETWDRVFTALYEQTAIAFRAGLHMAGGIVRSAR
ncbi:transposase [Kitasatospora sp. NPDC101183]|uniref:transposase n=1 Tax=Kitasatospora sp. NPDC101183 TaxID=3364100 RepID=UPI00380BC2D3